MAIARDASSPTDWALTVSGTTGSGTSASFTPPVDSVISVSFLCDTAAGSTSSAASVSNTGFTTGGWTVHVERGDSEGTAGHVAIATAVVTASAAGTITATVTNIGSTGGGTRGRAWADVWTGADTTASRLADATPNEGSSTSNNITPTAADTISADARVIGVAEDWNALGAGTSTDTEGTVHIAGVISGMRVYKASDSTSGTSPTLNFDASGTSAADWNWCAIALKVGGGSNTTITPGGGSVVLTGAAPTVTGGTQVIRPAGGSVVLSGGVPTITGGTMLIRPGGGSVVLSGAAPTVTRTENQSITPAGGSVVLSGAAPTVSKTENHFITPAGGSVVLTGAAPTVTDSGATSFTITPDAGILVLGGAAPTITVSDHRTITPDGGSVVLNGAAPTLTISGPILITPDAGQIILTGFAPIVSNSSVSAAEEQPTGGWKRRTRRRKWYERLPTAEEIQAEREALGILPKKAQEIVAKVVKKSADVETQQQAATLAAAYLEEQQQRRLMDRLRKESADKKAKWRDEMFAIAHALILDALRKKADQEMLARLIAEQEAEYLEVNDILSLWMQM